MSDEPIPEVIIIEAERIGSHIPALIIGNVACQPIKTDLRETVVLEGTAWIPDWAVLAECGRPVAYRLTASDHVSESIVGPAQCVENGVFIIVFDRLDQTVRGIVIVGAGADSTDVAGGIVRVGAARIYLWRDYSDRTVGSHSRSLQASDLLTLAGPSRSAASLAPSTAAATTTSVGRRRRRTGIPCVDDNARRSVPRIRLNDVAGAGQRYFPDATSRIVLDAHCMLGAIICGV